MNYKCQLKGIFNSISITMYVMPSVFSRPSIKDLMCWRIFRIGIRFIGMKFSILATPGRIEHHPRFVTKKC